MCAKELPSTCLRKGGPRLLLDVQLTQGRLLPLSVAGESPAALRFQGLLYQEPWCPISIRFGYSWGEPRASIICFLIFGCVLDIFQREGEHLKK